MPVFNISICTSSSVFFFLSFVAFLSFFCCSVRHLFFLSIFFYDVSSFLFFTNFLRIQKFLKIFSQSCNKFSQPYFLLHILLPFLYNFTKLHISFFVPSGFSSKFLLIFTQLSSFVASPIKFTMILCLLFLFLPWLFLFFISFLKAFIYALAQAFNSSFYRGFNFILLYLFSLIPTFFFILWTLFLKLPKFLQYFLNLWW